MTFNIYQQVFDRDGMPFEKKASQYQDQLLQLFEQSPEGQALRDEGIDGNWTSLLIDFGIHYLSVTPAQMASHHLREILFELFPHKVSASADEAPNIIREFQLFWQFLQREFNLENAAACLSILDEEAVRKLKRAMSNPANFGIAKSFVMMGMERGFDLGSEEGINQWMVNYNAELAAGTGQRIPLPGEENATAQQFRAWLTHRTTRSKRKRNRRRK
jgi:hypothetical protein